MSRRDLLLAGLAGLCLPAFSVHANGPAAARPFHIFMILHRGYTDVERGFLTQLKERGIEVQVTMRDIAQDTNRIAAYVAEARAAKPDLIYCFGTPVAVGVVGTWDKVDPARHVTDIPVLFTMVADPVGSRLVAKRASSGRNITGASHVVPMARQVTAMRAYGPMRRLGVLINPAEPSSVRMLRELRPAAANERFQLTHFNLPLDEQKKPIVSALPQVMTRVAQSGIQLLYLGPDSFIGEHRRTITELALRLRLPTFSATEVMLRDGRALFGLVSNYENLGRLCAWKAEQMLVLKVRPQDIPVETLARFSYIVNMTVAAALDCYPPLKVANFAEILR